MGECLVSITLIAIGEIGLADIGATKTDRWEQCLVSITLTAVEEIGYS
jgi:hypothetical protein